MNFALLYVAQGRGQVFERFDIETEARKRAEKLVNEGIHPVTLTQIIGTAHRKVGWT